MNAGSERRWEREGIRLEKYLTTRPSDCGWMQRMREREGLRTIPKFLAWAKGRDGNTYQVPVWSQALVLCAMYSFRVILTASI